MKKMYIELLWLLISLSVSFLVIGYWRKYPFIVMIGWTFMFIISVNFLNQGLDYQSGDVTTIETLEANLTIQTSVIQYTNYDTHLFPWLLAICSGLGFVTVFFTKDLW